MLRPATPLTIILLIAFILLLLATISTPIIKGIPLASVNGVSLGVFGYCTPTGCTGIKIGYAVDAQTLFGDASADKNFSISPSTRSSLSSILIVHPIAALLVLICLIMSAAAHFHGPSHSSRYLIAILIVSIPTLLITLLAFLVDLLLFVPHLAWGGWIVLGSTVLLLAAGIVTCAMRRTVVSRKDRKKRIAENPEMSGQTFYANQNPVPQGVKPPSIRAESPPPLSSSHGQSDELPKFSSPADQRTLDDDRVPLNQRATHNNTPPNYLPNNPRPGPMNDYNMRGSQRGGMRGGRGARGGYRAPRDEYGNPLPPSNAFGPPPPMGMRRDRSEPPMRQDWDNGMGGGYGPPGGRSRGYPPPNYGRGGGSGRGRGGYANGRGRGPEFRGGPPPPGYMNGSGYQDEYQMSDASSIRTAGPPPLAGYGRSPSAPGSRRRPEFSGDDMPIAAYQNGSSISDRQPQGAYTPTPPPILTSSVGYAGQPVYGKTPIQPYRSPNSPTSPAYDPGAIGQAIEMDARHGSPSRTSFAPAVQQHNSMTSEYSEAEHYVPPRAGWKANPSSLGPNGSRNASPYGGSGQNSSPDLAQGAVELPAAVDFHESSMVSPTHHKKRPSENYHEDVDPRFSEGITPPFLTGSSLDGPKVEAPAGTTGPDMVPAKLVPAALNPHHVHSPYQMRDEQTREVQGHGGHVDLGELDGYSVPPGQHSDHTAGPRMDFDNPRPTPMPVHHGQAF